MSSTSLRTMSGLDIALGLWLFISPWVFGAYSQHNAWNSWIVGAAIAVFAMIQFSGTAVPQVFGVLNALLGAWMFFSPWIFRYAGDRDRFVNSLCVGAVVFILSTFSAAGSERGSSSTPHPLHP
jgi:hypothetical protein